MVTSSHHEGAEAQSPLFASPPLQKQKSIYMLVWFPKKLSLVAGYIGACISMARERGASRCCLLNAKRSKVTLPEMAMLLKLEGMPSSKRNLRKRGLGAPRDVKYIHFCGDIY